MMYSSYGCQQPRNKRSLRSFAVSVGVCKLHKSVAKSNGTAVLGLLLMISTHALIHILLNLD